MAKSLLKKAKKAAKSVKKEVKSASSVKSKVSDIRSHVEKLSGERRDCAVIWTVIKANPNYASDEAIINLIKLKEYNTLLGEVS